MVQACYPGVRGKPSTVRALRAPLAVLHPLLVDDDPAGLDVGLDLQCWCLDRGLGPDRGGRLKRLHVSSSWVVRWEKHMVPRGAVMVESGIGYRAPVGSLSLSQPPVSCREGKDHARTPRLTTSPAPQQSGCWVSGACEARWTLLSPDRSGVEHGMGKTCQGSCRTEARPTRDTALEVGLQPDSAA